MLDDFEAVDLISGKLARESLSRSDFNRLTYLSISWCHGAEATSAVIKPATVNLKPSICFPAPESLGRPANCTS